MEGLLSHVLYLCIAVIEIRSAEQSQIMLVLRLLHTNVGSSSFHRLGLPKFPLEKSDNSFLAHSWGPVGLCAVICLKPTAHHTSSILKWRLSFRHYHRAGSRNSLGAILHSKVGAALSEISSRYSKSKSNPEP